MKQKKNLIWKCLAVLPLLGLAACTGNDEPSAPPATQQGKAEITLMVDAGVSETRSTPDDPVEGTDGVLNGKQHVEKVRLYVFEPTGESGKMKCIGIEDESSWSSLDYAEGYSESNEGKTVAKKYMVETSLSSKTTYTLLATGYEKTEVYGIEGLSVGSTVNLADLISTLQSGGTKETIQTNEYFTGSLEVTTVDGGRFPEGTTVEMHRRVAGLSTCFEIDEESFTSNDKTPAYVAVMLYTNQKKAVPTLEQIWQEPNFTDYAEGDKYSLPENPDATDETSSKCLMWLTVPDKTANQSEKEPSEDGDSKDPDNPTDLDKDENGGGTTGGGTATQALYSNERNAIYLLPIPAPEFTVETNETNYTLAVAVYDANRDVICTKRAALAANNELIFNTSLGTGIVDDESYYRYPIVANRFYRFGTEDDPMEIIYDPLKPFEVIVESAWEGMPELDFAD